MLSRAYAELLRQARRNSPIIVFEIADGGIDDVVSSLAGKGVTIVTPASHAPGGWSSEFADPDDHVISMYQSAEAPRSLKKIVNA